MLFQPRQSEHTNPQLRAALADNGKFLELTKRYIDNAVEACDAKEAGFKLFLQKALELHAEEAARAIVKFAQSPIEREFTRALVLSFLKTDGLGLLVYSTITDTATEVSDFRQAFSASRYFEQRGHFPSSHNGLVRLLNNEHTSGRLPIEEWRRLSSLFAKYQFAALDSSYHMTLQPQFPDIVVADKSVRADLYFWIPKHPDINIIVECDGYQYHWTKLRFIGDRQRDRKLFAHGYSVLRFSGSEINRDPMAAADELTACLRERAKAADAALAKASRDRKKKRPIPSLPEYQP